MPSRGVCPCVCMSRSWTVSKRIKDIFEIFSPSGSHTILVFSTSKRDGDIPMGTPLTGASNAGGVGRNRDSEPIYMPAVDAETGEVL